MLNHHNENFVLAWKNLIRHFGHRVTSREKGARNVVKEFILISKDNLSESCEQIVQSIESLQVELTTGNKCKYCLSRRTSISYILTCQKKRRPVPIDTNAMLVYYHHYLGNPLLPSAATDHCRKKETVSRWFRRLLAPQSDLFITSSHYSSHT